jgi:hypothetical protein
VDYHPLGEVDLVEMAGLVEGADLVLRLVGPVDGFGRLELDLLGLVRLAYYQCVF